MYNYQRDRVAPEKPDSDRPSLFIPRKTTAEVVIMIIYKATNLINGKVYIGQTTVSLQERRQCHYRKAFYKDRPWRGHFHHAIKKYGWDSFSWEIIDKAKNKKELNKLEKYWIRFYFSFYREHGYNLTTGGDSYEMSPETRRKISEAQKGRIIPQSRIEQLKKEMRGSGNHFYGKKHTEETKRKISENRKGKGLGQTELQKVKCPHRGSRNGNSKLTERDVRNIRIMFRDGARYADILRLYNISRPTVKQIKFNKTWRHVTI
jgi:group I intron endonuclease